MATRLTDDPYLILLRHDRWATGRILDCCAQLSPEQFHQRFDIGPGSLHDTLTHVISVMRRWADRISERPVRPTMERPPEWYTDESDGCDRDVAELRRLLEDASDELASVIRQAQAEGMDRVFRFPMASPAGPQPYTLNKSGALVHVFTHGHYHRAQCVNMLRRLNVPGTIDRLPDLDISEWQNDVDRREHGSSDQ